MIKPKPSRKTKAEKELKQLKGLKSMKVNSHQRTSDANSWNHPS